MKLGNSQQQGSTSPGLIERMREAHAEGRAAVGARATSSDKEVAITAPTPTFPPTCPPDPLAGKLLEFARALLDNKSGSDSALRETILELFITAQANPIVLDSDREEYIDTMKSALIDDPGFSHQVDQMLIHAARILGQEHLEG